MDLIMKITPRILEKLNRFSIVLTLALILIGYGTSYAHPHMFYSTQAIYEFNDKGLECILIKWRMDEYTSVLIRDSYDNNQDGKLSEEEFSKLENDELERVKGDDYYIHLKVDGKAVSLPEITDFKINTSNENILIYSFKIPLIITKSSYVDLAQYDSTYFTDFQPEDFQPVKTRYGEIFGAKSLIRTDESVSFYFDQFHPVESRVEFTINIPSADDSEAIDSFNVESKVLQSEDLVDSKNVEINLNSDKEIVEDKKDNIPEIESVNIGPSRNSKVNEKSKIEKKNTLIRISDNSDKELDKMESEDSNPIIDEINIGPPEDKFIEEVEIVKESIFDKINNMQESIKVRIMTVLRQGKGEGYSHELFILLLLSFSYGLIHVIGPGHGKSLTISYVIADGKKLKKALLLGILIPIMHSLSGVLVVLVLSKILQLSVLTAMDDLTRSTQLVSYAMMILLGIWITICSLRNWKKESSNLENSKHSKSTLWAIFIVGIVPCPGVIFLLLFGKALGVFKLGILFAFFMMLGMVTGLTLLTLIAYFTRNRAVKNINKSSSATNRIENILELVGGLMIVGYSALFFISSFV
jgi:ABC-type nickel/cobalt efflux system permease component RcnA/ABC-type uncharacterized transport system substrate-binding protein